MPLNCKPGDWEGFVRRYRRVDSQWYLIPKAKAYTEDSVRLIIEGLRILNDWLGDPEGLTKESKDFLENYLKTPQQELFEDDPFIFKWSTPIEVFITAILFDAGVISREQQDEKLRATFDDIINAVKSGKTYCQLTREFGKECLVSMFAANSRNFINICQRLGLAWIEQNHLVTITSVGRLLIENGMDYYKPLFEHQLRKLQFYNPSLERSSERYGGIKVFPFYFCLQLITDLHPHEITKEEFALFVTKSISMEDVDKCLGWITEFRHLDESQQANIIERISRPQRGRPRPLLVETLETASKNINFLTLCGPWQRAIIGSSEGIVLTDINTARQLLSEDSKLQFTEFDSKESWFCYYGDVSRRFDIDAALEYYARKGEVDKAEELVEKADNVEQAKQKLRDRLKEKQIEDFFRDNLSLIEEGLVLFTQGDRNGQQFETPDGGIVDLLTKTRDDKFVVIEFKRDKASDEAVGQTLRYMGWVRRNLSPTRPVRSYIVGCDFDKYIKYALHGMQHPLIPNERGYDLIQLFSHGMNVDGMRSVSLQ